MTRARRGMTLIELVVALAITGMMAVMGTAAFGSIIDHRRIIVSATSGVERAGAVREQLRAWLVSGTIQISTGGTPRGIARAGAPAIATPTIASPMGSNSSTAAITAAVAAGDEITFVTTAPNPANAPSVRMRLFVDGDPNTPETGLTLEYQASNFAPLKRIELEPAIGVLKVEFLDQRTNRWLESTQAAALTPMAVRISMQPYDGGSLSGILQLPMIFPMGQLLVGR